MNTAITPIFVSHYSLFRSLLTLEEPGRAKAGNPVSVFALAQQANLQEVIVCDSHVDGFLEGYKTASKLGLKLCFGLKLKVCADMNDRTLESRRTESSVVVLVRNSQGYHDLLRIWNRAWGKEGHFAYRDASYGRADWGLLKTYWTENLGLALPYFSSFIAKNLLTFAQITPDLPVAAPWVLKEEGNGLPFAPLIDAAIGRYTNGDSSMVVPSKTILYARPEDFRAYCTFRAIGTRGEFSAPGVDHLASLAFSFQSWQELNSKAETP